VESCARAFFGRAGIRIYGSSYENFRVGADFSSISRAELLFAMKKSDEAGIVPDPFRPMSAKANMASDGQVRARERRGGPRLKCEGSVAFRTEGIDMPTWATFTDISIGGCYVELAATLPVKTPVNMVLDVKGVRVEVKGAVRTSYPLVGMGIEFTNVTEPQRLGLEEILRRLESNLGQPDKFVAFAVPLPLLIVDPAAALNAVASFFEQSQSLTREQFAELMGSLMARSREGDPGAPR
jgi:hypothetical protein